MQADAVASVSSGPDVGHLMILYQQADPSAAAALIELLSPRLYRFFASQMGSRTDAEDMLQTFGYAFTGYGIHTARANPFSLACTQSRTVYESTITERDIESREVGADVLPEPFGQNAQTNNLPPFDELVAALPESQREVLI